jgi:hypothetical protein
MEPPPLDKLLSDNKTTPVDLQDYLDKGGNFTWAIPPNRVYLPLHFLLMNYTKFSNEKLLELVDFLLTHGADPNTKDTYSYDTIYALISLINRYKTSDLNNIFARILEYPQININKVDNQKLSYLDQAVSDRSYKNSELVKLLIDKGINVNLRRSYDKSTALIRTIENVFESFYETAEGKQTMSTIVKLLLDAGADKTIRNRNNRAAIDYVKPGMFGSEQQEIKARLKTGQMNNNNNNSERQLVFGTNNTSSNNINPESRILSKKIDNIEIPEFKTRDAKRTKVSEPVDVFDAIEYSDIPLTIKEIVDDKENIYFKIRNSFFRINREYLIDSIKKYDNIIYQCKKSMGGAPRINDINEDKPYFLLRTSAIYTVPLEYLKAALKSNDWVYELKEDTNMKFTSSFASILSDYGTNYAGRNVNIVSADHCQDGSSRQAYSIHIIELVPKESNMPTKRHKVGGTRRIRNPRTRTRNPRTRNPRTRRNR